MYFEIMFTDSVLYRFYVCLQKKTARIYGPNLYSHKRYGLGVILSITKRKETTPNGHTVSVH